MFSLESPRRGHIIYHFQCKIINLNYSKSAAIGCFSKGPKDEFETAVVNEPQCSSH